jgi:hypothetical protein
MDEAVSRTRAVLAAAELQAEKDNSADQSDAENPEDIASLRSLPGILFDTAQGKPSFQKKIVLDCSVTRLGLHLKLLYDEGIFVLISKVQLCRMVCALFCTRNQKEISPRSLKNAMDSPDEKAYRMFREKWLPYLERAEEGLSIN